MADFSWAFKMDGRKGPLVLQCHYFMFLEKSSLFVVQQGHFICSLSRRSIWTSAPSPSEKNSTTASARKSTSRAEPKAQPSRWIGLTASRAAALCTHTESWQSETTPFFPCCPQPPHTHLFHWRWKATWCGKSATRTRTWEFPSWSQKCRGSSSKARLQSGEKENGIVSKSVRLLIFFPPETWKK